MVLLACSGASTEPEAVPTQAPTATTAPTPTTAPTKQPSLNEAAAACLESRLGEESAQAVLSGLVSLSEEQQSARTDCLLAASLSSKSAQDSEITACLEEKLGSSLAQVVASGAVPLTDSESAALGECVVSASLGSADSASADPFTACLEEELGAELARVLASGAVPPSAEQEAVLGGCRLSVALAGGSESGTEGGSSSNVTPAVLTCLERELGDDVAAVVASGAIPLSASEEAVMGQCLLEGVLAGGS